MSKTIRRAIAPLWVSQNFLTSGRTIGRLLTRTNLCAHDSVIEIGPGKGHITRALAQRCAKVTAVELDAALFATLQQKFAAVPNVRLVHQDFLTWRLPPTGEYKVFSNIPFSHTTDIVRRLTECANPPQDMWLVMEKGAAKRFLGIPREGLRSLALKPFFDARIVYHFQRGDFHPMPRVDTVLVHFARKPEPDLPLALLGKYQHFLRTQLERGPCADMLYVQWLCLFRRCAGLPRLLRCKN